MPETELTEPAQAAAEPAPAKRGGFLPAVVRHRLLGGAMMWLIGSSILVARGAAYLQDRKWHAWALAAALMLGVAKSHYILNQVATKAVARIRERERAPFFTFFSWRAWLLVAAMMGSGMLLRRLVVHPNQIGAGILGALYLGVGAAIFFADRIFWQAVAEEYVAHSDAKAAAALAAAEEAAAEAESSGSAAAEAALGDDRLVPLEDVQPTTE